MNTPPQGPNTSAFPTAGGDAAQPRSAASSLHGPHAPASGSTSISLCESDLQMLADLPPLDSSPPPVPPIDGPGAERGARAQFERLAGQGRDFLADHGRDLSEQGQEYARRGRVMAGRGAARARQWLSTNPGRATAAGAALLLCVAVISALTWSSGSDEAEQGAQASVPSPPIAPAVDRPATPTASAAGAIVAPTTDTFDEPQPAETRRERKRRTHAVGKSRRLRADRMTQRAKEHLRNGRLWHAERSYRGAIRLAPGRLSARIGLVNTLLAQGKGRAALKLAKRIVARHPNNPKAQLALGDAHDKAAGAHKRSAKRAWRKAAKLGDGEARRRLNG